nr:MULTISPECIES: phosphopantothenoylcysteine decarboxylase [unclassified Oceanicaulis]|tara:strand:- start:4918 stop:5550 length:633 start_codon:yes stop_codon:yes gene_type:complete
MKAIVTAGPTLEPIDPVRFLSNRSSGQQGYAIAEALRDLGFEVVLISGPVALNDPKGLQTVRIETAREMLAAVNDQLPADVFVSVAAVADWRPAETADRKLKLDKGAMASLPLAENPDILKTISHYGPGQRPRLVVGFAAETHDVVAHARAKRDRKGCDWIVANDVSGDVMGGAENAALLITPDGEEAFARAAKSELARNLASRIKQALS